MAVPKSNKHKDYARYAAHCLNMVAVVKDQETRSIQREMAAEWLRLADAELGSAKRWQMQMGDRPPQLTELPGTSSAVRRFKYR